MFSKHYGGEKVRGGMYWSVDEWEFVAVPPEGTTLRGGREAQYVQVPTPLVLLAAPVMGLALAMFLPLSGILGAGSLLARWLGGSFRIATARAALAPRPAGVSHLQPEPARAGQGTISATAVSREEEGKLANLAHEVSTRRREITVDPTIHHSGVA